jgi:hypothetical protein
MNKTKISLNYDSMNKKGKKYFKFKKNVKNLSLEKYQKLVASSYEGG